MEARTNPVHLAENDASTTATPKIADLAVGQTRQALQDVAFGSIAGIIGKFVEYPFDTVKVRLQSQPQNKPLQYTGPLDCFRQSWQRDGLRGLYRGISAPIVGAAIETSSLFFSYRVAQDILQSTYYAPTTDPSSASSTQTTPINPSPLPMRALILCGAASGAATSLLLTPIELVKCKMQVPASSSTHPNTTTPGPGPIQLITTIFRTQGLLGFWHGQLGTLIRETGGSAAWFGSFEGMSLLFRNLRTRKENEGKMVEAGGKSAEKEQPLPIHQQLIAGASAGMAYNFVFYPADTIKSRMQTEEVRSSSSGGAGGAGLGAGSSSRRQTFYQVGRALWRDQGLKGMYRGCGITVGRAAPSSALIFTVYEYLKGMQL